LDFDFIVVFCGKTNVMATIWTRKGAVISGSLDKMLRQARILKVATKKDVWVTNGSRGVRVSPVFFAGDEVHYDGHKCLVTFGISEKAARIPLNYEIYIQPVHSSIDIGNGRGLGAWVNANSRKLA
jgi:hypothetical protein